MNPNIRKRFYQNSTVKAYKYFLYAFLISMSIILVIMGIDTEGIMFFLVYLYFLCILL
jgi:hypothetical protein